MKFRDVFGSLTLLFFILTLSTAMCGDLLNQENDGLQPAQAAVATVLGYSRFTQCEKNWNQDHTDYRWNCNYWKPERIVVRPYRSWLVAPEAIAPLLRWNYVLGELTLSLLLILLAIGLEEMD